MRGLRLSFIILFLSWSRCNSANGEQEIPLDDFLVKILELLREELPFGLAEAGIPPLDPFDLPHVEVPHLEWVPQGNQTVWDFVLRDTIVSLDIDVKDIVVRNLSTFTINEAHISLDELTLSLELNVSKLRVREWERLLRDCWLSL